MFWKRNLWKEMSDSFVTSFLVFLLSLSLSRCVFLSFYLTILCSRALLFGSQGKTKQGDTYNRYKNKTTFFRVNICTYCYLQHYKTHIDLSNTTNPICSGMGYKSLSTSLSLSPSRCVRERGRREEPKSEEFGLPFAALFKLLQVHRSLILPQDGAK